MSAGTDNQEHLQSSIVQQSFESEQTISTDKMESINEQNSNKCFTTVVNNELEFARIMQAQESATVSSDQTSRCISSMNSESSYPTAKDSFDLDKVKSNSCSEDNDDLLKIENSEFLNEQSENFYKDKQIDTKLSESKINDSSTSKMLDIDDNLILQSLNNRDFAVYNKMYATSEMEESSKLEKDVSSENKYDFSSLSNNDQVLSSDLTENRSNNTTTYDNSLYDQCDITDIKVLLDSLENSNVDMIKVNDSSNNNVHCKKSSDCTVTLDKYNVKDSSILCNQSLLDQKNVQIGQSTQILTSVNVDENDEASFITEITNIKTVVDHNAFQDEIDDHKESFVSDKSSIGNNDSRRSSDVVINSFQSMQWLKTPEMGRNQKPILQSLPKKEERISEFVEGTKKKKNNKKRNEKIKILNSPESETASGTDKIQASEQTSVWKEDSSKELFADRHAQIESQEEEDLKLAIAESLKNEKGEKKQDVVHENMNRKDNPDGGEWCTVQRNNNQSREASKSGYNHPPGVALDHYGRPIHGRSGKDDLSNRKPGFNQSSDEWKGNSFTQNHNNQSLRGEERRANQDPTQRNNSNRQDDFKRNQENFRDQSFNRQDEYNRYSRTNNKDYDRDYRQDGQQNKYQANRDHDRNYRQDGQQNRYGNRDQDRDYRQDGQYNRYGNRDHERDYRQDGQQNRYGNRDQDRDYRQDGQHGRYNNRESDRDRYDNRQQNYSNRSEQASNSRDNSVRRDSIRRGQDDDRNRNQNNTGRNDDYNRNSNFTDRGRDLYRNQDQQKRMDYNNKGQDTRNRNQDNVRNYNNEKHRDERAQINNISKVNQSEENWDEEPSIPKANNNTKVQSEHDQKEIEPQTSDIKNIKSSDNPRNSLSPDGLESQKNDESENVCLSTHSEVKAENPIEINESTNSRSAVNSPVNLQEVENPEVIEESSNTKSTNSSMTSSNLGNVEQLPSQDQALTLVSQNLNQETVDYLQESMRSTPSPTIVTYDGNQDHLTALMTHLQENVMYTPTSNVATLDSSQNIQHVSGLSPEHQTENQLMITSDYVTDETTCTNLNPNAPNFNPPASSVNQNPAIKKISHSKMDATVPPFNVNGLSSTFGSGNRLSKNRIETVSSTINFSSPSLLNGNFFSIATILFPPHHEKWDEYMKLRARAMQAYEDLACVQAELFAFENNLLKSLQVQEQTPGTTYSNLPCYCKNQQTGQLIVRNPSLNPSMSVAQAYTRVTTPTVLRHPVLNPMPKNLTSDLSVGTTELLKPSSIGSYQMYSQTLDLNQMFSQANSSSQAMVAPVNMSSIYTEPVCQSGVNRTLNQGQKHRFSGCEYMSAKVQVPPGYLPIVQSMPKLPGTPYVSEGPYLLVDPNDSQYAANTTDQRLGHHQLQKKMNLMVQQGAYYQQPIEQTPAVNKFYNLRSDPINQ